MTLREIEETLRTLEDRHPGLNEVMLTTLLQAGGWEEKNIEEARVVFRSSSTIANRAGTEALPPLQENPLFEPEIDAQHLLERGHGDTSPSEAETTKEKESLIEDDTVGVGVREDLPHNLPLRPFETSEHIWPFSRYRDVFYGDEPVQEVHQEAPRADAVTPSISLPKEEVVVPPRTEPSIPPPATPVIPPSEIHLEKVPLQKGDDKLVFTASLMLLFILLILGYMYANGRL